MRVDLPQLRNVFFFLLAGALDATVRFQLARINADPTKITRLHRLDLKHQTTKRLFDIRLANFGDRVLFRIHTLNRRTIEWTRQIILDRIQYALHAHTMQCRTANDRLNHPLQRRTANHIPNKIVGDRFFFHGQRHHFVAVFTKRFDHDLAGKIGFLLQLLRDRRLLELFAVLLKRLIFHLDQIDHSAERVVYVLRSQTNRHLNRQWITAQSLPNLVQNSLKPSALAIEFVDKANPRHLVLVGLPPNGLALRLDSLSRAEYDDRSIQHSQTTFDFGCKIDVPRRVDQVNVDVFPLKRHTSRIDRDSAILLLFVGVGLGRTFVHAPSAMNRPTDE